MLYTLIVPSFCALSVLATAVAAAAPVAPLASFTGLPRRPAIASSQQPSVLPSRVVDPSPPASVTATFKVVTEIDKTIFQVFQDSKGMYWFGHDFGNGSGLYRWSGQGNTFDHFTTETGLPDNGIGRIQEDRLGNLYINMHQGICKFDGHTFTMLKLDEHQPAVTEVELGPDILWFKAGGDDPHALFYDGTSLRKLKIPKTPAGDKFEALLPREKYPRRGCPYDAYTIYKDSRGHVWFGSASLGACRFDGKTFAWIDQKELGFFDDNNAGFGTRSIIEDRDGKFWITVTRHRFDMHPPRDAAATTSAGGLSYIKSTGLPHAKADADEDYTYIMSMAKDQAGDLWMATYGAGVWRYSGKELTHYPVMVDGQHITLFSIYCDRADGLWLGTHEHGLLKFNGKSFERAKF